MPRVLPFAGLRYAAPSAELDRLICPPYDVISPEEQARLESLSPHNAVRVELPEDEDASAGQPLRARRGHAGVVATGRRAGSGFTACLLPVGDAVRIRRTNAATA